MVKGTMQCIKYLTFFFNFLFWLSGLGLIIIGAIIRFKYGNYFSYADHRFATAPLFISGIGAVVFVIGFLGCCGAVKENYWMVAMFAILLAIVFILEIVSGALGLAYKGKVKAAIGLALKRGVGNYKKELGAMKFMNFVQREIKCCGKSGAADYDASKTDECGVSKGVASCHKGGKCSGALYTQGCQRGFEDFVKKKMAVIGGVCIGIAFVEILGIVFACCLMKAIKNDYDPL